MAADQRYCLNCGERNFGPIPLLRELQRTSHLAPARPPRSSRPAPGPAADLCLPGPRLSALLVLVFLGFGTILGSAASSNSGALSAAARPHLKLVLGPATALAGSSTARPQRAGESESQAPSSEQQPTPQAAIQVPTKTTPAATFQARQQGSGQAGAASESAPVTLPHIKHVFLIVLSDEPYAAAFGPESKAGYLAHTLEGKGELLVRYDAIAHEELANGIALLSGQGPTTQTALNCPLYSDLAKRGLGAEEQVLGEGCVYPAATKTLPGQLAARHLKWRAYVQGTDESGAKAGACSHPVLGTADPTSEQTQSTGAYATFRNPLVYFHSILDSPACSADDVGLSHLKGDLAHASSTPSFAYIVPDRCHDGNPTPCTAGAPAGPASADGVLQQVVPEIMASKGYRQGGLIAITVDEAPSGGEFGDSSSCCGQPAFPNMGAPAARGGAPRGGGAVGALLISPFVKAGTTGQEPYDHFSLLRTLEDIFKVPHLGYAALTGVRPLAPSLFTAKPKR